VVFSETAAPVGEQALRLAFQLTPAEARLAVALMAGETLNTYCERNGITRDTAKTQLRQVFAKTGCSRQADLIRTLNADLAVRLAVAQQRTI
jgi:DNA-binding CsgD family transcriptional regulator